MWLCASWPVVEALAVAVPFLFGGRSAMMSRENRAILESGNCAVITFRHRDQHANGLFCALTLRGAGAERRGKHFPGLSLWGGQDACQACGAVIEFQGQTCLV